MKYALVLLTISFGTAHAADTSLDKYTCGTEWSGFKSNGSTESEFRCSNGHSYFERTVVCKFKRHGLIFTTEDEELVSLLCDTKRTSVAECLADNKTNPDIPKCQAEADEEHLDFLRRNHEAPFEPSITPEPAAH